MTHGHTVVRRDTGTSLRFALSRSSKLVGVFMVFVHKTSYSVSMLQKQYKQHILIAASPSSNLRAMPFGVSSAMRAAIKALLVGIKLRSEE